MSVNKQLLDPLGTLCKLITLNFYKVNTKISIHKHSLKVQEPDDYYFQSLLRTYGGDNRENISELFHVVKRVIEWYLYDNVQSSDNEDYNSTSFGSTSSNEHQNFLDIKQSEEVKKLAQYACLAFKRLQETYKYGNVYLAIQFYINSLNDGVVGTYTKNRMPNYMNGDESEQNNLLDYDKLKNFWTFDTLKRIIDIYDKCFEIKNDNKMHDVDKDRIINGYLNSSDAILNTVNEEFQKLLLNSQKG